MLKLIFLLLLAANAALFAYQQGHLDTLLPDGREPARSGRQINPDKVKLLTPAAAAQLTAAPAVAVADAPSAAKAVACTEVGDFNAAEARRFETQLAALAPSDKISRREIQEVSSHMVLIPSQLNKEGAEKKAGELRKLGVTDFYVIQDSSEHRWGISLGVFKTEEAARAHLSALNQKGVRSARLAPYQMTLNKTAFQLRDLEAGVKESLEKLRGEFPRQEVRACA